MTNLLKLIATVALGAGVGACGSTNAGNPGTTTGPSGSPSVVPGTSLAAYEASVKSQLLEAQPKGFAVKGVDSVQCALPNAWTSGKVFNCFVYDKSGSGMGSVKVTVESTQPGDAYDTNVVWQPSPSYAGTTGGNTAGSTSTTAATPPATTAASGPATTFGDGTFLVGTQVKPGIYRTAGGSGCYWERDSGLGGTDGDILANGNSSSTPVIVEIASTDKAFQTRSCGTWSPEPATGAQATSFGPGDYAVGIDIAPGTYSAPGGSGCYWERASDFLNNTDDIIANNNATGPVVIAIAPTDKEFESNGCGSWTKG